MVYLEKADVVVAYEEEIRSPSFSMPTPAVIRVRKAMANMKRGVKFSRVNIYTRDKFTCQYCGQQLTSRHLSYDHVTPRAAGGLTEWTNIVTACKPCNNKKGQLTCDEAGMWPRKAPVRPKSLPLTGPLVDPQAAPEEWQAFLAGAV